MRQITVFAASSVLFALAVSLATYRTAAQTAIHADPFTATVVEKRFDASGDYKEQETYTYAVRSDGSSVEVFNRKYPDGQVRNARIVIDTSLGKRIVIEPATQSLTTTKLSKSNLEMLASRLTACRDSASVERVKVLGFSTVRETIRWADAQDHGDQWVAQVLDCYPLRLKVYLGANRSGSRNEREVTAVSLGEPDGGLFAIPSEYVERAPSDVMDGLSKEFPQAKILPSPQNAVGAQTMPQPK